MRGQDRDASTPRSRRHKEERCPRLRPAVCATAGAGRPVRPRWRSGAPSACAAVAANGTFFRNALDSCERLMRTPSRASISARSRGIVQLRRSATGCSSNGVATRNAVSLFTGIGPGATLAFSAAISPPAKSLRQSRTVSSRTPNASAMCGLVQPASVNSTARALSASPRSREPASVVRAARCSSVAVSGDFPAMSYTCESVPETNQNHIRWSTYRIFAQPVTLPRSPGEYTPHATAAAPAPRRPPKPSQPWRRPGLDANLVVRILVFAGRRSDAGTCAERSPIVGTAGDGEGRLADQRVNSGVRRDRAEQQREDKQAAHVGNLPRRSINPKGEPR